MGKLWVWLDGKKTYLTAGVMAIAALLQGLEIISQEKYTWVMTIAIPAVVAFIRQGVEKNK
jgi:hypothetical protein